MVTGIRQGTLAAVIQSGKHKWLSGLSSSLGGKDEGAGPHELLEAALASCTILTVQLYANRKQWKLDSTDVKVEIVKKDEAGTKIRREIVFRGELSTEQKARLLQIAEKCPIHNLLIGKVEIETVSL